MSLPRIAPLTAPPALDLSDPLTDQAARWAEHALRNASHLPPAYVTRKALDAVAFSLRHDLRSLSVPSTLVGVARHPPAVEALVWTHDLPLALRPRLVVSGLGHRAEGRPGTLGVNDRMTGIADIDVQTARRSGGGERPTALAVRLWRDAEGTARMTCPHASRHSPSGSECGSRGSGPADGARSVLLALVHEVTAEARYQAFQDEVIAALPQHGAGLERTAVLAWLSGWARATR